MSLNGDLIVQSNHTMAVLVVCSIVLTCYLDLNRILPKDRTSLFKALMQWCDQIILSIGRLNWQEILASKTMEGLALVVIAVDLVEILLW